MLTPLPIMTVAEAMGAEALRVPGADTITGIAIDSREVAQGDLFFALPGSRVDGHDYVSAAIDAGAAAVVVGRPVPCSVTQLVVPDPEAALGVCAALIRDAYEGVLVGITGSAGKTTAKNLLAAVLAQAGSVIATKGNQNNELGVPLTLAALQSTTEFAVVEMGAGKPGDIAALCAIARPTVGVLLNVAPAHIAAYRDLDDIADTKGAIVANLPLNGVAIINGDQPWSDEWAERAAPTKVIRVGFSANVDVRADDIDLMGFEGARFTIVGLGAPLTVTIAMPGHQGVFNSLVAAAVARALGISDRAIQQGLAAVTPAAGRGLTHVLPDQVLLVDDSYNANPLSVRAAIDSLAASRHPQHLVLGSMLELGEHSIDAHAEIGCYARTRGIDSLWCVGSETLPALEAFGAGARYFDDCTALLAAEPRLNGPATVLVKGSRGVGLEALVTQWSAVSEQVSC